MFTIFKQLPSDINVLILKRALKGKQELFLAVSKLKYVLKNIYNKLIY